MPQAADSDTELVCRMFIRECPSVRPLWETGRMEPGHAALADSVGAVRGVRAVPFWTEMAQPPYSHLDLPLDLGHAGAARPLVRDPQHLRWLQTALPAAGASSGRIWVAHLSPSQYISRTLTLREP